MLVAFLDASALIKRYALDLQQALSSESGRLVFWSCDKRLLRAAKAEGIVVFDPENETSERLSELLQHNPLDCAAAP